MESLESKKLALIRILQILEEYSDADHPPICTRRGPFLRPEGSVQGERRRKNLTKKQVQVIIAF